MEDVLELTRGLGREPNLETALHILQWELGDLAKAVTYMRWHPGLEQGYKAEASLALASLIFQARVCIALLDLNLVEIIHLGEEIVRERIQEKEKKLGRFQYYKGEEKL